MKQTALQYSVKLLSKKDYSIFKLTQKLVSKEYTTEETQSTIQTLLDKKYLREDVYTEDKSISLINRHYGNLYIHNKLSEEMLFISDELLSQLRDERNLSESNVISLLIEKKESLLITDDKLQRYRKISSYLVSKGFDFSIIEDKLIL